MIKPFRTTCPNCDKLINYRAVYINDNKLNISFHCKNCHRETIIVCTIEEVILRRPFQNNQNWMNDD